MNTPTGRTTPAARAWLDSDGGCGVRGADGVTAFPTALGLAASFDSALAREYGAAIGAEVRSAGYVEGVQSRHVVAQGQDLEVLLGVRSSAATRSGRTGPTGSASARMSPELHGCNIRHHTRD
jgi:hypothetical protein